MTSHIEWERGDRCRDCGIRPDEALGLEFCQCPGKQPIDELAERAYYAGFQACARATADAIPRAALVAALRERAAEIDANLAAGHLKSEVDFHVGRGLLLISLAKLIEDRIFPPKPTEGT